MSRSNGLRTTQKESGTTPLENLGGRCTRLHLPYPGCVSYSCSGSNVSQRLFTDSHRAAHIPSRTPRRAALSSIVVPPVFGMWMNTARGKPLGSGGLSTKPCVPTYAPRAAASEELSEAGWRSSPPSEPTEGSARVASEPEPSTTRDAPASEARHRANTAAMSARRIVAIDRTARRGRE